MSLCENRFFRVFFLNKLMRSMGFGVFCVFRVLFFSEKGLLIYFVIIVKCKYVEGTEEISL